MRLTNALCASVLVALPVLAACSSDSNKGSGGSGGTSSGGTSSGGTSSGGTSSGGTSSGGTSQGGGGATAQGGGGTTAQGGGGTTAQGGGGATAQGGNGGSTAGAGGGSSGPTTIYDFENGVQGWSTDTAAGAAVAVSTDQHSDGTQSLKFSFPALDGTDTTIPDNISVSVNTPPLWPGMVVTLHVYLPTGFPTTGIYLQAFTQFNNYAVYDTTGNGTKTLTAGAWNTWTYTVPNTFPGGIQVLGIQLGDNGGGSAIPAGDLFIDAITVSGGNTDCAAAGPGTGTQDFEAASVDASVKIDDVNGSPPTDTAIAVSTDQHFGTTGTQSLKVTFTNLPAPTTGTTNRSIYINNPAIYCGQQVTLHVYIPASADTLAFKGYTHYNWFAKVDAQGPATITRDAWQEYVYTVPSDVGPQGIQRIGVQFNYSGTAAFTGSAYIDAISW